MSQIKEIRIVSSQTVLIETKRRQYRIRAEDWFESRFKKNQKLTKQDISFLVEKSVSWLIHEYCLRQLAISQKSKTGLKSKTKIKIVESLKKNKIKFATDRLEELIDIELNKLEENKLIDDSQYVLGFINKSKKKSNRQIEYELKHKGVGEDIVREALALRENSEAEVIRNLINKKLKNNYKLSFQERAKLMASLIRRGFSIDTVKSIIDERVKMK